MVTEYKAKPDAEINPIIAPIRTSRDSVIVNHYINAKKSNNHCYQC